MNPRKWVPLLVSLRERHVVVFGGGAVATRRAGGMVKSCKKIVVISAEFTPKLEKLATRYPHLVLVRRRITLDTELEEYVKDADLVVTATDDSHLNSRIARVGRAAKKLVNRIDDPVDSDVIFPAVLRRGDVIVAVSTGGKSPLLSKQLLQRLARTITKADIGMARLLDHSRRLVAREFAEEHVRRRVLKKVASDMTIKNMLDRGSLRQAKTRARRIILGLD